MSERTAYNFDKKYGADSWMKLRKMAEEGWPLEDMRAHFVSEEKAIARNLLSMKLKILLGISYREYLLNRRRENAQKTD